MARNARVATCPSCKRRVTQRQRWLWRHEKCPHCDEDLHPPTRYEQMSAMNAIGHIMDDEFNRKRARRHR